VQTCALPISGVRETFHHRDCGTAGQPLADPVRVAGRREGEGEEMARPEGFEPPTNGFGSREIPVTAKDCRASPFARSDLAGFCARPARPARTSLEAIWRLAPKLSAAQSME